MNNLFNQLQGKTVLIVGGTSGIGLSAAIQAKAAGAAVIITGFDAGRAAAVAAEHGFAGHRVFDVTRTDTVAPALADMPGVDHLVLMAGSFVAGKVLEAEVSYLQRAFDERVWAAVHILRALGDRLAADASITFISGVLADRPNAYGTAILAAASAAMEALARGLALELAPRRVNTLSPGPIDTPLLGKALGAGRDAYVAHLESTLPLRRLGSADEAGAAVVFLMANRNMNGATLHIDGGAGLV
ncbi:SDR family oxidoreductase [Pseudoduganella sp. FT25W]|uniref:SDR family oxidoreductase n=1 Tax=Duganella alba TaxID=2666081 RepID=A0A6L5QDP5_9BURK|nr:SDR family oxidoreductase [Duganella alba]MRX07874.1 SDR family oxidoreductase [Duganella alba]MRX15477.1 SDR family oxidoreductase [Duganella alba]